MTRLLPICFVFVAGIAFAQDPQFSQYYQSPLYLNPGFVGITPQQRIVLNHRLQWPSLPQAFSTYAFSYDIFVDELTSGFGILATTDKMGSAGWRTTTAGVLYSFKVRLGENLVFSPGLYFGYGQNGLDRNKIILGDGLRYKKDEVYYSLDPEQQRLGNQSYFDAGSGFVFYSRSLWLGAAFEHMNRPNISVLGDESRLPMKVAIHGGARFDLSGSSPFQNTGRVSYLTPSFIFRTQGPTFSQMDMGVNYHIDPVSVGLWYRGKPWQKTVINSVHQDAMIIMLGMYFDSFNIGYSYDFTVSELQTASGGAHEISIVYEFVAKPIARRVRKDVKMLPCPTFHQKSGFWNK